MNREKRAQLASDISLISFLLALLFVIASFFFTAQMWYLIAGALAALAAMKYADAVKARRYDGDARRARRDLTAAVVFTAAALTLFLMQLLK